MSLGPSCWTANKGDFRQYLTVDLGNLYNLTAIGTQGRRFTNEYVQEYQLLVSDESEFWRMAYSDPQGTREALTLFFILYSLLTF